MVRPVINFDTPTVRVPRAGRRRGKDTITAHLFSTIPGPAGTAELIAFAKSIGFRERWIQDRGTHREHFDLIGEGPIKRAREAGAKEVTIRAFGKVLRSKRAFYSAIKQAQKQT